MAEENPETVLKDENKKEESSREDVKSQIQAAMKARVGYIKEQSNSLTMEGVRRLLEKDLGLERFSLDKHKQFVKQYLDELTLDSSEDEDSNNGEDGEKRSDAETVKTDVCTEEAESVEDHRGGKDASDTLSHDTSKIDESPESGLPKEHKTTKSKTEKTDKSEEVIEKKAPSNKTITEAIRKRAKYLKANSEQLTLAGLRRLLEEDLELEKLSLDPYKKFIRDQVDELLIAEKVSQPSASVKRKVATKSFKGKVARKARSDDSSDSVDSGSDEDEVKPKVKNVSKQKKSNEPMKRKRPTQDTKIAGKKIKAKKILTDGNGDEDNGNFSEDSQSHSSEKSTKSKMSSIPVYEKRVEHLKSVIKSCGMSVPPALYKKVKQVPENKRESQLIKELEEMLSKEGLSADPSEKEIKEVRKKKERAKELEGIDTSNIVSSTRRRSTSSYLPPPKPKIPIESDSESLEDEDEDEDEDDEDGEEENGNDGSQSEASNVDDDVNSD